MSTSATNYLNRVIKKKIRKVHVPTMHNYSKEAELISLVTLHKELKVRKDLKHLVLITYISLHAWDNKQA